jgi:DNA-binding transcriptional LysR family regulator
MDMAMELRHLRYFITVAEEGHVTRAAERLGMQQPPLSQQIKALERELDVQLFRRKPRGVELTDAGQVFLHDARAMLAHLDQACETTRRTARGEQGSLSVGYTSGAALHPIVSCVIREFRHVFPSVSVSLAEDYSKELVERMRNDQIDIAFIRTAIASSDSLKVELLHEESPIVAIPSDHPLARGKRNNAAVQLKALAGETFIAFGNPNGELTLQNNALVTACQAAGFNPNIKQLVSHNLSRLNLVAAGLGVCVSPASVQRINIDGVAYLGLKGTAQFKIPLNLVSRRGDPSAVVQQFLKMVRRTGKELRIGGGKA